MSGTLISRLKKMHILNVTQALLDEGISEEEIPSAFEEFDRNPPEDWLKAKALISNTLADLEAATANI